MLNGLSVIDGSMATSVLRRRIWWRVAGVSLLVLSAALATAAGACAEGDFVRKHAELWPLLSLSVPCIAVALGIAGYRLLLRNRKSPRNRNLHRWSLGFGIAGLIAMQPIFGMCMIPIIVMRKADRTSTG